MSASPLKPIYSGKVRDLYEVDHGTMLMVATDRISVFDVVLPDLVPDKGRVLTALSSWWFERTSDMITNHVVSSDPTDLPEVAGEFAGRAMLVKVTTPLRMECVVRGYLYGGAWTEYRERSTIGGFAAPSGLREADRLEKPLFTPSTKADTGHDEPLDEAEARALIGDDRYEAVRAASLALYEFGARHAESRGLVLADTKFEFGLRDDQLILIDELMTPDSSRYWPADGWSPGTSPPSFDKQYVRDHMMATGWNKEPPAPSMPEAVISNTRAKYIDAYELITGLSFADWY